MKPFVIKYADFTTLKLLDANNEFHNEVHIAKAKELADVAGLDLVCFNKPSGSNLAFCKILDYGKWRYAEEKKQKKLKKENKKHNKEIRFSPVIDQNDINHKLKQATDFLEDGSEVTFTMILKGRQKAHYKEAEERMNSIILMCDNGKEVSRSKTGGSISVRLTKKKEEK
jgi:translation initiation factor IF-3